MTETKTFRRRGPAKAVGAFLPDVTRKAFQKFGFPAAALLTDWKTIVGPQIAAFTQPERLKWPKQDPELAADQDQPAVNAAGTLVLRVDGPLAIELQHQSDQILERINSYFGYRAIASLRIVQAPLDQITLPTGTKASPKPRDVLSPARRKELTAVQNPALRDALAGLSRRIESQPNH